MNIKEQEKRIGLLEKEVALHKEILELKRQILACEKGLGSPYKTYEVPSHWQPCCDGTGDLPLPPQNVTIC